VNSLNFEEEALFVGDVGDVVSADGFVNLWADAPAILETFRHYVVVQQC